MFERKGNFQKGRFLSRENRFVVWISDDGNKLRCHLPNPGRMVNLLIEDTTDLLYIPVAEGSNRKTDGTVIGVIQENNNIINLDTMMFNPLLKQEINQNSLDLFVTWEIIQSEYTIGNHRFDFLLDIGGKRVITEVKSTTRVIDGIACFPDAVSKRAQNHLLKLHELAINDKQDTMVIFVVYQEANEFEPCATIDPQFAKVFSEVRHKIKIHVLQVRGYLKDQNTIIYDIVNEIPLSGN